MRYKYLTNPTNNIKIAEFTINGNKDQDKVIEYAEGLGFKTVYKRFEGIGYRIFFDISNCTDCNLAISDILQFASNNGIYAYYSN